MCDVNFILPERHGWIACVPGNRKIIFDDQVIELSFRLHFTKLESRQSNKADKYWNMD